MQPRRQVFLPQALAHAAEYKAVQGMTVAEADLCLGRVDVDIHLVRRKLQEEKGSCITAGHEQAAIGFLEGMSQTAVADPAAVEKQVLHLGVAALASRVAYEAVQPRRPLASFQ